MMYCGLSVQIHGLPDQFDPDEVVKRIVSALRAEFKPEYDSDIMVEWDETAGALGWPQYLLQSGHPDVRNLMRFDGPTRRAVDFTATGKECKLSSSPKYGEAAKLPRIQRISATQAEQLIAEAKHNEDA